MCGRVEIGDRVMGDWIMAIRTEVRGLCVCMRDGTSLGVPGCGRGDGAKEEMDKGD